MTYDTPEELDAMAEQYEQRSAGVVEIDPAKLAALCRELAQAKRALAFYANPNNYSPGPEMTSPGKHRESIVGREHGARARAALEPPRED